MEDREVIAAIVSGDPAGLAEAYDRYGVALYAYCRSLLREPADAADALQDTFLIAAARLRELRDPARLRPWFYAVARNECLRRLRAGKAMAAPAEAKDVLSPPADVSRETERADLRELVRTAIFGLNPGERDVIELSLVHELEGHDLADALGVSGNHADALLSRARTQLDRSLGALVVARTGRPGCLVLDLVLRDWDGPLTVLMRKRVSRHIAQCEICGERKRHTLTPALFAGLTPLVLVTPGFRDQLLRIMADRTPAGLSQRLSVANGAGRFGPAGFPTPVRAPWASPWHRTVNPSAAVASAATSVVAAGAIAVVVIGGVPHDPSSASGDGTTHGAPASTGSPSSARRGPAVNKGSGLAPLAAASSSRSGGTTSPHSPGVAVASSSAVATTVSSPSAASSASARPSATPVVSQGTVTASPGTLDLVTVDGTASGKFTLTASGGPVSDYSITAGPTLVGKLTVSPSTGALAAGKSVTVTVTSTSLVALDGQLTVSPGGQTVTVLVSIGL